MTVRQAFSLAFGEVPEGATCHMGYVSRSGLKLLEPTIVCDGEPHEWFMTRWESQVWMKEPIGNDISDLPAEVFVAIGIFGERYDKAVRGEL